MALGVRGTGVALRAATDEEAAAAAAARRGKDYELTPARSFEMRAPEPPPGPDDVLVVAQAFAELSDGSDRWTSIEHHGHAVPGDRDATLELLRLADDVADDLTDLLAELRIHGLGITRWALFSAPRRIELAPDLAARLAPLRRG
jgi:hypothetical protein